ncbi:hypothetical protein [Streptomyces sp. NBC_00370]|uniref:hypothetical protein n=1 Tax=Streptomyces sp. NBC_00370 TaxID=2975728 RepID=UPI002E261E86
MSLDPQPVQNDDLPVEPGNEPIRTLLWTAATIRPLDEVAALVSLLKRTGEFPSPGDEALRAAAVSRPVDEVRQLVAMLNEPPHETDEADTALRAVAVGRSIEDVAQLVNILGSEEDESGATAAPRSAPPADGHADERPGAGAEEQRFAERAAQERQPEPAARLEAPVPPVGAARTSTASGAPAAPAAPRRRTNPVVGRTADRTVSPALRSVLRWPAAVALLVIGVIHLPTDFAGLRSGGYANGVSLVVTVLCLVLAVLLAVQDTVWVWAASALAAVAIVAAHSVAAGFGTVHLLANSLGDSFGWATTAAVVCAVLAAVLSGSALSRRQKTAGAPTDA